MIVRRYLLLSLTISFLGLGCYTVPDSALTRHYTSVYVPVFENRTFEPLLQERVTRALRRELQNDGYLRLENTADAADLTIEGVLTEYRVRAGSLDFEDEPLRFDVYIYGDVLARDNRTGEIVWERPGLRSHDFYQARRTTSGRQREAGLNEAAEAFAEAIVYDLVDSEW